MPGSGMDESHNGHCFPGLFPDLCAMGVGGRTGHSVPGACRLWVPHRAHALPRARPTARTPYHEHAEGPPVRTLRVAPPVHHLRRHVLDRPAEGVGSLVVVDGLFTQPEIYRDTPHTALSLWVVLRPLAARPALPTSLPGPRGLQRLSQAPRLPVRFCRDEHVQECSQGYQESVF